MTQKRTKKSLSRLFSLTRNSPMNLAVVSTSGITPPFVSPHCSSDFPVSRKGSKREGNAQRICNTTFAKHVFPGFANPQACSRCGSVAWPVDRRMSLPSRTMNSVSGKDRTWDDGEKSVGKTVRACVRETIGCTRRFPRVNTST